MYLTAREAAMNVLYRARISVGEDRQGIVNYIEKEFKDTAEELLNDISADSIGVVIELLEELGEAIAMERNLSGN